MSSALNQLLDWLDLRIDDCLHELINNTVDFQLVLGQDKVNESKKKAIQEFLTKLIGKVVKNFKFEELFKDSLLKVMSILIKSYSFPPFKYFSKFEAQRLPLTKFGSYSLMSQEHQKMVLLVFLFIRSIIFSNLFKVWQFYPNKGNQAQILLIQKNSVILSSILHDIIIKWVSKTLPIKQKDLNDLKKQMDFNDYPLSDNLEEIKKSNKTFPDYMLIEGLLSQTILLKYTHNENNVRFEWIDRLEKQIMEFCDLILDQFDRYHRDTTNIKERLIQQMIKIDQENNRFKTRKRK